MFTLCPQPLSLKLMVFIFILFETDSFSGLAHWLVVTALKVATKFRGNLRNIQKRRLILLLLSHFRIYKLNFLTNGSLNEM